jgi:hypothetical protein
VGGVMTRVEIKEKGMAKQDLSMGTNNTAVEFHSGAAPAAKPHPKGRLFALVESSFPYVVKAPSLATVGAHDYGGKLRHPFTAHPKAPPPPFAHPPLIPRRSTRGRGRCFSSATALRGPPTAATARCHPKGSSCAPSPSKSTPPS